MKRYVQFAIWCIIFTFLINIISADEKNIYFLDRDKGEPQATIKELEAITERDAVSSTALGWLYLIYENNAVKSKSYFEEAHAKDPSSTDALDGLSTVYYWLGEDELSAKQVMEQMKLNPDAPELDMLTENLRIGDIDLQSGKQEYGFIKELLSKPLKNKFNETFLKEWSTYYESAFTGDETNCFKNWLTMYPDKWQVIGYFSPNNTNCLDDVFPPEKEINLSAKYTVKDWDVKWHQYIATVSNHHNFNDELTESLENNGNCFYLLTWINSPTDRPVGLRFYCNNSYKIWLNDMVIGQSNRKQNYEPNYQIHGGFLQQGSNKLLIKFIGRPSSGIRIISSEGAPYDDLTYEITPPANPVIVTTKETPKIPRANYDYFAQRLKDPQKRNINDYFYQYAIYSRDGLKQEAFAVCEELYNSHKASALVNVLMGEAYQHNDYLPLEKRNNLALKCFKEAEKLAPDFVDAKLLMADYYSQKNKDKAIEYLKKAIAVNPHCIRAYQKLEKVFKEQNWHAEAFDSLTKLQQLLPDNASIAYMLGKYYEQLSNYDKALSYFKHYYDLTGYKYHAYEMYLLAQRGNYEPYINYYLEMTQVYPEKAYYYKALLDLYFLQKQYEKVEQLYQKLLSLCSSDSEKYRYYDSIADFYYEWGKPDKAREYWEMANKLPAKYQVYKDGIRRYLDFKDNKNEIWPEEIPVSVEELVKNAPSEKEYPEAGSIILFEEHLVKIIGENENNLRTKETLSHEVVKLLNKEAGERYGDLYKYGELLCARVFTKDGRILEPDPIQESGGSLRLPELDNGTVIELKYIKREPFYYRNPDEVIQIEDSSCFRRSKEPILWLRYMVNIPKSIKYKLPAKYLEYSPKKKEDDKSTTYIWEIKNIPDYDKEVMMPDEKEVLPWIDIYTGSFCFDNKIQEFYSRYLKEHVPYNVRGKAEELTKDIESPIEKIKALYKFAVSEIKGGYGGSGGPGSDESLSQTIIEKEGSASALMMGSLNALNIEAYWALPQPKFMPGKDPDKEGLDIEKYSALIYIPPSAVSDTLDAGIFIAPAQFQPFGVIPSAIQGGNAYVIMPEGIKVVEIPIAPFPELCGNSLNLNIKLLDNGSAEITGALEMGGEYGTYIRAYLKEYATTQQKKQIVESITGQLFPGSKLNNFNLSEFDIEEKNTMINFSCEVPQFAQKTDYGFEFKPVIKPLQLNQIFLRKTNRKFALRLSNMVKALNVFDQIRITLPEKGIADVPKSFLLSTRYGYYSRWIKQEDGRITIERKFSLTENDIPPQYYQIFADFCKKIEQTESEMIKVKIKTD
jgi:tetratricopeptide (TPR) repeat protein